MKHQLILFVALLLIVACTSEDMSKGKGKRAGGRVIIQLTMTDTCLSFLYIYDKSDMPSVSDDFLDNIIVNFEQ